METLRKFICAAGVTNPNFYRKDTGVFSNLEFRMAVYTRLTPQQFDGLISSYGLGELVEAKEIAEGVENSNYLIRTRRKGEADTKYILTIFEKRVEVAYLPFYLGITRHLAEAGLPTPSPLRTQSGEVFTEVAGKKAAIVTFLEGHSIRHPEIDQLRSLGEHQAHMHNAAKSFPLSRPNDLSLAGWAGLMKQVTSGADDIMPGLNELIAKELSYLQAHWPRRLPSGVIHADLFPDNVFFTGKEVSGIIDFYFACNDFFMYDLVITLNAWCFERDGSFNLTKARAFLHAYDRVRPLSVEERQALPVLARGASLRFLLTRAYDWLHHEESALVTPKNPMEYIRKLRFHQQIKEAREYGL